MAAPGPDGLIRLAQSNLAKLQGGRAISGSADAAPPELNSSLMRRGSAGSPAAPGWTGNGQEPGACRPGRGAPGWAGPGRDRPVAEDERLHSLVAELLDRHEAVERRAAKEQAELAKDQAHIAKCLEEQSAVIADLGGQMTRHKQKFAAREAAFREVMQQAQTTLREAERRANEIAEAWCRPLSSSFTELRVEVGARGDQLEERSSQVLSELNSVAESCTRQVDAGHARTGALEGHLGKLSEQMQERFASLSTLSRLVDKATEELRLLDSKSQSALEEARVVGERIVAAGLVAEEVQATLPVLDGRIRALEAFDSRIRKLEADAVRATRDLENLRDHGKEQHQQALARLVQLEDRERQLPKRFQQLQASIDGVADTVEAAVSKQLVSVSKEARQAALVAQDQAESRLQELRHSVVGLESSARTREEAARQHADRTLSSLEDVQRRVVGMEAQLTGFRQQLADGGDCGKEEVQHASSSAQEALRRAAAACEDVQVTTLRVDAAGQVAEEAHAAARKAQRVMEELPRLQERLRSLEVKMQSSSGGWPVGGPDGGNAQVLALSRGLEDLRAATLPLQEKMGRVLTEAQTAQERVTSNSRVASAALETVRQVEARVHPLELAITEARAEAKAAVEVFQRRLENMAEDTRMSHRQPMERQAAELRSELRSASDLLQTRLEQQAADLRGLVHACGKEVDALSDEVHSLGVQSESTANIANEASAMAQRAADHAREVDQRKVNRREVDALVADLCQENRSSLTAVREHLGKELREAKGAIDACRSRLELTSAATTRLGESLDKTREADRRELSEQLADQCQQMEKRHAKLNTTLGAVTDSHASLESTCKEEARALQDSQRRLAVVEADLAETKSNVTSIVGAFCTLAHPPGATHLEACLHSTVT